MTRKHVGAALVVGAAIGGGLATPTTIGKSQPQATAAEFEQHVLPVLAKSCLTCHNDKSKAGALSLEPFTDPAAALAQPALWHTVLEKVSAGAMPPPTAAPLSATDRDAITNWI